MGAEDTGGTQRGPADGGAIAPNTVYFELDSQHVGDRFAIWVILPRGYGRERSGAFPVIYVTDGDSNALLAAAASYLVFGDHLRPIRTALQVCIGYVDKDPGRRFVRRNRDFTPPGENLAPHLERHVQAGAYAAALGEEGMRNFLAAARDGRADRFLDFIEEELHPEIAQRFRVDTSDVGLYGHSQGGLLTLYALTSGRQLFSVFGAGSPALVKEDSIVYASYRQRVAETHQTADEMRLHLVVNDEEMTGEINLYRAIGRGFLAFVELVRDHPLLGLSMTTAITRGENHFSGVLDAYRSFLRACYRC
jgi:predicted alpha/beta superfamily hydrolase